MAICLETKHLDVYYGDFKAVEDVNMTIETQTVTSLIGPSGCGKSTVLRTLNRMHEVTPGGRIEGEVLLNGDNLYGKDVDPVEVRRMIGMVFQRPNPFPTMSIKNNVLAGLHLNRVKISKDEGEQIVEELPKRREPGGKKSKIA